MRAVRGMTQSELAGDFITRNMLSLIENGYASPSLATLTEIAKRLGVSVGYFFAESEKETAAYTKMGELDHLQKLYHTGEYKECLHICDEFSPQDDEIALIALSCSLSLAEQSLASYALTTATAYLEKAEMYAQACMYADPTTLPTIRYLKMLIHAAGQEEIPKSLASPSAFASSAIPAEFIVYMRALCALDTGDTSTASVLFESGLISSMEYLDFLKAGLLIANGETEAAFPMLKRILTVPSLGFFTRYHVLTTLESCARVAGDFKAAYQYSSQKVHLLESYAK